MDNKLINYNDVVNLLGSSIKDFKIEYSEADTPYVIAGDFSVYLLRCYKAKSSDKLQQGLDFIEKLLVRGDDKTKELAIIGFLESIQNHWGNDQTNPENIFCTGVS